MNKTKIEWTDYTWNPIHARRKDGKLRSNEHLRVREFPAERLVSSVA
jgi:hypothetical protein